MSLQAPWRKLADNEVFSLAWVEIHSIMARMLLNFDMELCEESRHWHNQKVFSLWDKPPLQIKLSLHKV